MRTPDEIGPIILFARILEELRQRRNRNGIAQVHHMFNEIDGTVVESACYLESVGGHDCRRSRPSVRVDQEFHVAKR